MSTLSTGVARSFAEIALENSLLVMTITLHSLSSVSHSVNSVIAKKKKKKNGKNQRSLDLFPLCDAYRFSNFMCTAGLGNAMKMRVRTMLSMLVLASARATVSSLLLRPNIVMIVADGACSCSFRGLLCLPVSPSETIVALRFFPLLLLLLLLFPCSCALPHGCYSYF